MSGGFLSRNLAALARVNPELEGRIRLPVDGAHVEGDRLRVGRDSVPLSAGPAPRPASRRVLLVGVGLGEWIGPLLDQGVDLVAWDRDPWLLRLALDRYDLDRPLRQGRLHLALGPDLIDHVAPIGRGGGRGPPHPPHSPSGLARSALNPSSRASPPGESHLRKRERVLHPILGQVYRDERILLAEGCGRRRALVCTGELFVDDLADEIRARGWSVLPWEVRRQSREELARVARKVEPDFVASINLVHGLCEVCGALGLPLVAWEVDPATDALRPSGDTAHAWLFAHRRAQAEAWRAAGFAHADHLPLATAPRRRPVEVAPHERYPVAFAGASMIEQVPAFRARFEAAAERFLGAPSRAGAVLDALVAAQRREPGRYVIPDLLDAAVPGLRAWARERRLEDPAALAGEIAAAERRLALLAPLGRFGLRVWGDAGWRLLERHGVRYMGRAGHGDELNRVYCGAAVNVDVGRIYQPDIVTMRVFDVLACGGFVIAERSDDLGLLLEPEVEVATWSTPAELVEKTAWYLQRPEEARAVAERGRRRVLAEHTISARLDRMLARAGIAA